MPKALKVTLVLAGVGALIAAPFFFPVNHWLLSIVERIACAGLYGVAIFALVYVVATLVFLPAAVLTLGAGFAYGPWWGVLLVSPVSVLAATLAFIAGKAATRIWSEEGLARSPRLSVLRQAVAGQSFKIVLLLRLSPLIPFSVLNYGLGVTQIRLRDFVVGSFLGMLPGTIVYVYLGSLLVRASEILGGHQSTSSGLQQAAYWAGLVASVVVTVLITRIARNALHEAKMSQTVNPPRRDDVSESAP